jgi:hypothetical protein
MSALLLAGLNALVFHRLYLSACSIANENNQLPSGAKFAAVFSIALWITVIACGRLLAY